MTYNQFFVFKITKISDQVKLKGTFSLVESD